jgi:hypothetical protein
MDIINLRVSFKKSNDQSAPYSIFVYEDKDPDAATWAEVFCGQTKEEAINRCIKSMPNLLSGKSRR